MTSTESKLVRALGVWGLAATIVNVTIGGGIFRLPGTVARELGAAAPLAYLLCAVAMALIVLCFAEAGSRVSLTGGLYAYVEVAFGPFVGFVAGVMLWVALAAAAAAVSAFFIDAIAALVPAVAGSWARALLLGLIYAALAGLNIVGIRGANRFNAVLTVAKLLPLALFIVVGATLVRPENLQWTSAPSVGAVAKASSVLIFIFLGIEAGLVPSGEVREPSRTVPRAIFLAMAGITLIYLCVHLVAQGAVGDALAAESRTPIADAAGIMVGPMGRQFILVGSIISMFAYVSGMTLSVPRMLFAFARDGFLPRRLAAVHPSYRTPHVAIVVQAMITLALALSGTFETLAILANGSALLVYAVCCVAVVQLRRLDVRGGDVPFRVPGGAVVPFLALAVLALLLTQLGANEWKALGLVIGLSTVLYFVTRSVRLARQPA